MAYTRRFILLSAIALAAGTSLSAIQEPSDFGQSFPWFVKTPRDPVYPEILVGQDWMTRHLGRPEVVPVDLRPAKDYEAGHLPRAIHLDMTEETGSATSLLARLGLGGGETVILYGSQESRPAIGQAFLALSEIVEVRVLDADYDSWARSGLKTDTGPREIHPPLPSQAAPVREPSQVERDELFASFGRGGYEILDLRDEGWGAGYAAPPHFAAGHIPHALPFGVETLLPISGWPDPRQARKTLLSLGPRDSQRVDPDATFLLYGDGPRDPCVGLGFLLLKLMGFSVRAFSPGFPGWIGDDRNPVVRIVDAQEVREMLARERPNRKDAPPRGFILLDLREDWDYDESHIPGAVSLPERLLAERFDSSVHKHWPQADPATTPVVFYCYGRECVRSRDGATLAAQKGYRKLLWLREGMESWEP